MKSANDSLWQKKASVELLMIKNNGHIAQMNKQLHDNKVIIWTIFYLDCFF